MTEAAMELGEIVMTRTLDRGDATVLVEIGRPVPFTAGDSDCYVPFRIGDGPVMEAGGVDGVQAMLFALAMIGDVVKGDGLTFLGGEPGFPVTEPTEGVYVATLRVPMDMSLLDGSA